MLSFLKSTKAKREEKITEVNGLSESIVRDLKNLAKLTTQHAGPKDRFSTQINPTKKRIAKNIVKFAQLVAEQRELKAQDKEQDNIYAEILETQYAESSKSVMLIIEELGKEHFVRAIRFLQTVQFNGYQAYLEELKARPMMPPPLENEVVNLEVPQLLVDECSADDTVTSRVSSSTLSAVDAGPTPAHVRTKTFDIFSYLPTIDDHKVPLLPQAPTPTHRKKQRSLAVDLWKILVDTPPSTREAAAPKNKKTALKSMQSDKVLEQKIGKQTKLVTMTERLTAEKKLFNETTDNKVRKKCIANIEKMKEELRNKIKKYEKEGLFPTVNEPTAVRGVNRTVINDCYWKYAMNALDDKDKKLSPFVSVAKVQPVAKALPQESVTDDEALEFLLTTGKRNTKFLSLATSPQSVEQPSVTSALSLPLSSPSVATSSTSLVDTSKGQSSPLLSQGSFGRSSSTSRFVLSPLPLSPSSPETERVKFDGN